MGVNGQLGGDALALEKVLRNIVRMFMDGKLAYKPIRTMRLGRAHTTDVERLRTARRESGRLHRLGATLEEVRAE